MAFKKYGQDKFRYIKLKSKIDGSEIIVDTSNANYDRIAKGFLNTLKLKNYFVKHIILTQAQESYKPRILHNFLMALKRRYGKDIVYIWTVELQQKRFERTGEAVIHWHIMLGFPYEVGLSFGKEDILKLQSYWKYGGLKVVPVRKISLGYLMKYLKKDLVEDIGLKELFEKVRRIGTSRIAGYMKQGFQHVVEMLSFFAMNQIDPDEFFWYRGNAFLYLDHDFRRGREYVYRRSKNYEFVGGYNEECAY